MSDNHDSGADDLERELDETRVAYAHDEAPSSELDARIRAAAHSASHLAGPGRWRDPRWISGLATAAVLVLSVSVFFAGDPELASLPTRSQDVPKVQGSVQESVQKPVQETMQETTLGALREQEYKESDEITPFTASEPSPVAASVIEQLSTATADEDRAVNGTDTPMRQRTEATRQAELAHDMRDAVDDGPLEKRDVLAEEVMAPGLATEPQTDTQTGRQAKASPAPQVPSPADPPALTRRLKAAAAGALADDIETVRASGCGSLALPAGMSLVAPVRAESDQKDRTSNQVVVMRAGVVHTITCQPPRWQVEPPFAASAADTATE